MDPFGLFDDLLPDEPIMESKTSKTALTMIDSTPFSHQNLENKSKPTHNQTIKHKTSSSQLPTTVNTLQSISAQYRTIAAQIADVGTSNDPFFLSALQSSQFGIPSSETIPILETSLPNNTFANSAMNSLTATLASTSSTQTAYEHFENVSADLSKSMTVVPYLDERTSLTKLSSCQNELLRNLFYNDGDNDDDIDIDALWDDKPSTKYTNGVSSICKSVKYDRFNNQNILSKSNRDNINHVQKIDNFVFPTTLAPNNVAMLSTPVAMIWFGNNNITGALFNENIVQNVYNHNDININNINYSKCDQVNQVRFDTSNFIKYDQNEIEQYQNDEKSEKSEKSEKNHGLQYENALNIKTVSKFIKDNTNTITFYGPFLILKNPLPIRHLIQHENSIYSPQNIFTKPTAPPQNSNHDSDPQKVIITSKNTSLQPSVDLTSDTETIYHTQYNPLYIAHTIPYHMPVILSSRLNALTLPWVSVGKMRIRFFGCFNCGLNHRLGECPDGKNQSKINRNAEGKDVAQDVINIDKGSDGDFGSGGGSGSGGGNRWDKADRITVIKADGSSNSNNNNNNNTQNSNAQNNNNQNTQNYQHNYNKNIPNNYNNSNVNNINNDNQQQKSSYHYQPQSYNNYNQGGGGGFRAPPPPPPPPSQGNINDQNRQRDRQYNNQQYQNYQGNNQMNQYNHNYQNNQQNYQNNQNNYYNNNNTTNNSNTGFRPPPPPPPPSSRWS